MTQNDIIKLAIEETVKSLNVGMQDNHLRGLVEHINKLVAERNKEQEKISQAIPILKDPYKSEIMEEANKRHAANPPKIWSVNDAPHNSSGTN